MWRPALMLVAFGLLGTWKTTAQPVRLTATVDRARVTTDDVVRYEIEVVGATPGSIAQPALPPLDGLTADNPFPIVLSEAMSGQPPRTVYRWTLRPLTAGVARIGATAVRIDAAAGRTAPLTVTVRPGRGAPPAPPTPGAAPFGAGPPATAQPLGPRDVLLRATASTRQTVVGAQVVVEYRLYARPDIDLRFSPAGGWNAAGFWREDLSVPLRPLPRTATLDGRRYSSIVVQRVALFPTQPGPLVVPALTIEGEADVPVAAALYGPAAPRTTTPFRVTSPPVPIRVDALPAPPGFSGLAGQVRIDAALDTTRAETGESVRVRLRVSGDANLSALEAPRLALPDSAFDVFEAEATLQAIRTGARLTATRTFTYSLVPRRAGTYRLPPIALIVYNPASARFETRRADPGTLFIEPGPAQNDADLDATEPEPAARAPRANGHLWGAGLLALLAALLGGWAWRRRRGASASVPNPSQSFGRVVALHARLDAAEEALAARQPQQAAARLAEALGEAVTAGVPIPDVSRQALHERLNAAQFSPVPPDADTLQADLKWLRAQVHSHFAHPSRTSG